MNRLELAGALIGIAGYAPYIRSVVRKTTSPSVVSWLVWTVQGAIIAATYLGLRQYEGLMLVLAYTIGPGIITGLSVYYGALMQISRLEVGALIGCAVALSIWFFSGHPEWALYCTVAVDACGGIPTVVKTFKNPLSEDLLSWSIFLTGNTLTLLSIDQRSFSSLLYPVYLVILCLLIVFPAGYAKIKFRSCTTA